MLKAVSTAGLLLLAVLASLPALASGQPHHLVSASGLSTADGVGRLVHITLDLPAGADDGAAVAAALRREGATPLPGGAAADQVLSGIRWRQFFDHKKNNDYVAQLYNPAGQTLPGVDVALQQAEATWSGLPTATFAYQYGGMTNLGAAFDGNSVVSWPAAWTHDPSALGLTTTFFSTVSGFILDADVEVNSAYPFFVDPGQPFGFDLERVLLHEDGHAAGLDHSPDPNAVMFPFLGPGSVSRDLGSGDVAAISDLYPLEFVPVPNHEPKPPKPPKLPRSPTFTVMARLGDPAPGGWVYDYDFQPYGLNDRGEAAFAAGFFDESAGQAGELAATAGDEGARTLLARSGDPAPPASDGATFGAGVWVNIGINDAGDAAFAFALDPFGYPYGVNAGVYRWSAAQNSLLAVVRPGVTPAPSGGVFVGAYTHADINKRGDVAFAGIVPTSMGIEGDLGLGVYLADPAGPISVVAGPGTPAPSGGVFDFAQTPSINDRGDVAFGGHVHGEPCLDEAPPDLAIHCDESLYLWHAGGRIESLVHAGDPAPGGGIFASAFAPVLNKRGDVLFLGDLTPGGGRVDVGVFLYSDGTVTPVAVPGQAMPGGEHFVQAAYQYGNWTLNDSGEVAFSALLDGDSIGFGQNDTGVYTWKGGKLSLVVRTGSTVEGVGTVQKLMPPSWWGAPFSGAVLNNNGDILFQATITAPEDPPFADGAGVLLKAN